MTKGKVAVILLLLAGAATWWAANYYSSSGEVLPPLHTEQVGHGDVSQRVVAYGRLEPVQKVTVGSQVSGIVDQIFVDFNSVVERGQVIAQIDPSTFEAEVSSAQAELESAEAGLDLARTRWERVQELRERQFISPSEVEEASSTLRQAEAQVEVRRHALQRAQRELDRCTIKSPTDGIVISREVDVGQTVAASLSAPILFELAASLDRMLIHASVSEADIGNVLEGQRATFRVDAHRDRNFEGEVIQVRNSPMMEDNVVHYETIIAVDNSEQLLKPGMTTEVEIITEEKQDVMRVRNTALRARLPDNLRPADPDEAFDDGRTVYRLQNGELVAHSVRTGLTDGVYTEILEGVSPGDTLAVGLSLRSEQNGNDRSFMTGSQAQY
ncbi:efflux RND transporter periplasmic adaptor subunit [Rhodohalobacter sp. SW132]|uniref:efflux RND transporter periplasmic adaptor subunit n=1 Tax=Rhodohalobacter sp. SW132 TaxID=2293433 RepID=UPI000E26ECEC|nr:efflux RND transporter periplasmic adaptor subunit [Rhodohalobacter sp. SW132]REL37793.1 efflux RND transporter periplasmic adaptor subunit [Rhodohalobacter sp. SW132]